MDGFKSPRRRPTRPAVAAPQVSPTPQQRPAPVQPESITAPVPPAQPTQPVSASTPDQAAPKPASNSTRSRKKVLMGVVIAAAACLLVAVGAGLIWYKTALMPVDSGGDTRTRVQVVSGMAPSDIGALLKDKQLIRSTLAFDIYTRIHSSRNQLQAGAYNLAPTLTLPEVVDHLTSGKVDTFQITFYPGATLRDDTSTQSSKKTDVRTVLLGAGFSSDEVESALTASYQSPLFASKPSGATLEGYVYGETYAANSSMKASDVLQMAFNEHYKQIVAHDLVAKFAAQGLDLHQGIIMASIIQSEMGSQKADMAQVAQVFLKRYRENTALGSDVTAYYGADLLGKSRAVSVDSAYNTRIRVGLPAGPISSPGLAALQAVGAPAKGEYVYFLSGDDRKTYFAVTNEQHERNIADHCQVGCSIP